MEYTEFLGQLEEKYSFNSSIRKLSVKQRDSETMVCLIVDTYGIEHKSLYVVVDGQDEPYYDIENWVETLINGIDSIKHLNDYLADKYDSNTGVTTKVWFRFCLTNETKSIIYSWDYDNIEIGLSRKSTALLCELGNLINDHSDTFDNTGLKSAIEIIVETQLGKSIGLNFDVLNVYDSLAYNMYSRKEVMDYLGNVTDKQGIMELTSVLASESLGIVCRFKWEVNFDTLGIITRVEDRKILKVDTQEFVRDPEIIKGIEKLYNPTASEIIEVMQ